MLSQVAQEATERRMQIRRPAGEARGNPTQANVTAPAANQRNPPVTRQTPVLTFNLRNNAHRTRKTHSERR